MEQTNRHHRQSEFEAFTAIVRSLQSTSEQLSDDGMKFLNTAAKFYKITPERLKAEIRQHAARSANAAPRIQRSSQKENPKLPENSKVWMLALLIVNPSASGSLYLIHRRKSIAVELKASTLKISCFCVWSRQKQGRGSCVCLIFARAGEGGLFFIWSMWETQNSKKNLNLT